MSFSLPVEFSRDINVIHETLDIKGQVGGVGTHELFKLLTLLEETNQSPGLGLHIQPVLLPKLLTKMVHKYLIKVFSTQLRVKGCSKDLFSRQRDRMSHCHISKATMAKMS